MLPFGAGPRVCAGETFAMTRMFLIVAQMMKSFNILPPEEFQQPFDPRNMINGAALMEAMTQNFEIIVFSHYNFQWHTLKI